MQHIGLICPEVPGHLNPMTTLGQELQRRGYRVSLIARPDSEARARRAGLGFLPVGAAEYPPGSLVAQQAKLGQLSGEEAVRYTIGMLCSASRVILQEAPGAVREGGVDALLVDQLSHPGGTVAESLDLPFVTVCNALALIEEPDIPPFIVPWPYDPTPKGRARNARAYAGLMQMGQPILELVNGHRAEAGLPPNEALHQAASPLAQVAQQPACFDFPRKALPACFHYTGPFHHEASGDPVPFPYERLDGRPLIYASMGTLQNQQLGVFRTIATACAGQDAQLVLSLGRRDQVAPDDLPGSPVVVPFAPQIELLKRASLVITHAGLNTVLETLSQGVPMVALPITNDQPGVAARLAYLGAGELIPLAELAEEPLRAAVERVLTLPRFRERARALQAEIRRTDGLKLAADIAEQALTTRQPVTRSDPQPGAPQ